MKIKILKDIPGYKDGEKINCHIEEKFYNNYCIMKDGIYYRIDELIRRGYAEEIKETDIEAIRKNSRNYLLAPGKQLNPEAVLMDDKEFQFFIAYRIVKAVIDQLNGGWEPDWKNEEQAKVEIYLMHHESGYSLKSTNGYSAQSSIIPLCKNSETAEKVIELCEPELKVLFGVTK